MRSLLACGASPPDIGVSGPFLVGNRGENERPSPSHDDGATQAASLDGLGDGRPRDVLHPGVSSHRHRILFARVNRQPSTLKFGLELTLWRGAPPRLRRFSRENLSGPGWHDL